MENHYMNKAAIPASVDVSVLCIFFNRVNTFRAVFERVKSARPKRLFLYQDGPRNSSDNNCILECRHVAQNIDWDCEVFEFFNEQNQGCDPTVYNAVKWAFSFTDKCIVLEDDCVPSMSFFAFAKELLDKYENDSRINMICGMNNLGIKEDCQYDYFFARRGSIWGWASWARIIDKWDDNYSPLDCEDNINTIRKSFSHYSDFRAFYNLCKKRKKMHVAFHESINGLNQRMNHQLNIVPQRNMITNIGLTDDSAHSVSDIRLLPKRQQLLFNIKAYEVDFPLRHPAFVGINTNYDEALYNTRLRVFLNKIEIKCRKLYYSIYDRLEVRKKHDK